MSGGAGEGRPSRRETGATLPTGEEAARPHPGSRVSDYDYELPEGRIARYPADRRDDSRLLVVDRQGEGQRHLRFRDLPALMAPGDVLVLNESRVLPVRLLGRKPTGAPAEILLLRPAAPREDWEMAGEGRGGTGWGEVSFSR